MLALFVYVSQNMHSYEDQMSSRTRPRNKKWRGFIQCRINLPLMSEGTLMLEFLCYFPCNIITRKHSIAMDQPALLTQH